MAVLYKSTKFDTPVDPVSLTEQEHIASCDVNLMIKNALNGHSVRMSGQQPIYTYNESGEMVGPIDDLTLDALSHRIQKQKTEETLFDLAEKNEFEEEDLKHLPPHILKKFGFKFKKTKAKNDKSNDEKTPITTQIDPNTTKTGPSGIQPS